MGLFKKTKKAKKQAPKPADVAEQVFDEKYRDELRQMGRKHFKQLLDSSSADLKTDIDVILEQLTGSLRRHMASQLDLAISRVNNEISSQLKEKMNEYNRVSSEAQELVIQSLSRNAQSVHEKYQQMSGNIQQVLNNQEVQMVSVFQDNQAKVESVQAEQEQALNRLRENLDNTRHQSEEISRMMRESAEEQSRKIEDIYRENIDKTNDMKRAQEQALEAIKSSTDSLKSQHDKLQSMIDESIAKHREMATQMINDDMARIIEHYLVGALGERSDVTRDLPNILERLEGSKQAMMDDMKL